ncbi:MAG: hypothetical protein M1541_05285, partial [Acidobacteria bacterium]|nr:hypothetical protein [Acidobacteriota bacterium]
MRTLFLLASTVWTGGLLFGQGFPNLFCGVPANGSITADAPKAVFTFMGESNELTMIRVTSAIRANAILYDPNGAVVAPRPGPKGSFPEYSLYYAGQYKIAVQAPKTSTGDPAAGDFQIVRVRIDRPCSSNTLSCGSVSQGQLTAPNQVQAYQFSGTKDDVYSIRLVKTAGDTQTRFLVLVYDSAVNIVTDANLQIPVPDPRFSRLDVKLSSTGLNTILVVEYSGTRIGSYSLGLAKLNGPCNGKALGCGSALDASITDPLAMNAYSIDANAGDVFLLKAARTGGSGQFQPYAEIRDPQGNMVTPAPTRDITRFQFNAAVQGTYTVILADNYNLMQTGTYALSLARLNRPCNAQPVGCGTVADARIDGALRFQTYWIDAQAGDAFLLKLLRTDPNSGFKPLIEIYDPRGSKTQSVLAADLSRLSFKTEVTGAYTILASDGVDGTRTGTYTLSLARLNRPCDAAALKCGSAVAGVVDRPLRYSAFSYTASAGDSFTVRMVAAGGTTQPAIEVYDQQGNSVGTAVPGNSKGIDLTRPAAGNYVVLVSDDSSSPSGSFAMQLFSTRGGCAATPPQGQSVSGVVSRAAPFGAYAVRATAGDSLLLRSAGFTAGLSANMDLYDPDGVRLSSGTLSISRKVAATGVYTAVIGASDPKVAGNYAFSWQLLNNPAGVAPLGCGQTVSSTMASGAQFRYFSVDGGAGDLLKLLLTKVTSPLNVQLELYDSAGNRLAGSAAATPEINRRLADPG